MQLDPLNFNDVTNQQHNPFDFYRTTIEGLPAYVAGLPGYPRNFSRDVFTAGMIASDGELLSSQIAISSRYQAEGFDVITGAEPGKIHHEYPGVYIGSNRKLFATYDACDTTSLYLMAFQILSHMDSQIARSLVVAYKSNIEKAVGYLQNHVRHNIFYEFPPPGARRFALKATYWKDSVGPLSAAPQTTAYPIAYALAHFQAARGLDAAAQLLDRPDLNKAAESMYVAGIKMFLTSSKFVVACGPSVCLSQISSDELHALAYIPNRFADMLPLERIAERSKALVTPIGYACMPKVPAAKLSDSYHGYVVWPFEQAMINYGATKFRLKTQADIARRVAPEIKQGQELFDIEPQVKPRGNQRQLWSVAAAIYFESNQPQLLQHLWL